jgi:hypothetical protein
VYAGGAEGLTGPRHLDGTARAPDDLRGEEHIDSLPFSSALWTARSQLGSSFDRAVYDALTRAAPSATFDAMSAGVVDATERAMGRDAADLARAAFRARGLGVGTVRVVTAAPGLSFVLPAGVEALSYVPGYVQLAIDLAPGDSAVTLSFRADPHALIAGRVFARVGTPVQFHYGGDAGIQADADGSAMLASDGPRFSAHIDVRPTAQASRLFLAIAVDAGERTWATDLAWAVSGIAPLADAGADAGADASVAPSGSGCSARVTPRSDRASVCTLAVLLACLIRRRRP